MSHTEIAQALVKAEKEREPIEPIGKMLQPFNETDAYRIQGLTAADRISRGQRLVGFKIGLTSREAQRQFNIFKPDYGHLFDAMVVLPDEELSLEQLIQPKVEGEIAFVMGKDLSGSQLTIVEVMRAVEFACVAIEIVDSRIKDWKIEAVDTIADNGSSARFVLGSKRVRIDGLNLPYLGMSFRQNGEVVTTGAGAAVMGNPLVAIYHLVRELSEVGKGVREGDVILSGALSKMYSAKAKQFYCCEIQSLGSVGVRFK